MSQQNLIVGGPQSYTCTFSKGLDKRLTCLFSNESNESNKSNLSAFSTHIVVSLVNSRGWHRHSSWSPRWWAPSAVVKRDGGPSSLPGRGLSRDLQSHQRQLCWLHLGSCLTEKGDSLNVMSQRECHWVSLFQNVKEKGSEKPTKNSSRTFLFVKNMQFCTLLCSKGLVSLIYSV